MHQSVVTLPNSLVEHLIMFWDLGIWNFIIDDALTISPILYFVTYLPSRRFVGWQRCYWIVLVLGLKLNKIEVVFFVSVWEWEPWVCWLLLNMFFCLRGPLFKWNDKPYGMLEEEWVWRLPLHKRSKFFYGLCFTTGNFSHLRTREC